MRGARIAAAAVLFLSVAATACAALRLSEIEQIYREGDAAYEDISEQVKNNPQEINFEALRAINKNAAAWLYCPGTAIDYPVMKTDDYSYYLTHLPDGTENANGSLFIDYNCSPDFNSRLTVVYGHHMKSGAMFGSLKGYKAQSYYDEHPYMYLYMPQGYYRVELLYGCVIGAGQWRERAFMYEQNIQALLTYAARNTTFRSGAAHSEEDRVIALSTCSYEFDGARYVVIGVLRADR